MKAFPITRVIAAVLDVASIAAAPFLAALIRLGDLRQLNEPLLLYSILFGVAGVATYGFLRLYRGSWRYVSIEELSSALKCGLAGALLGSVAMFFRGDFLGFPRSIIPLSFIVAVSLLVTPRIVYRLLKEQVLPAARPGSKTAEPVIIYGFCDAAAHFIRQARKERERGLVPIAIIAHRDRHRGRSLHNVSVKGTLDDLPAIVRDAEADGHKITKLIVAYTHLTPAEFSVIVESAAQVGLQTLRMPNYTDFLDAEASHDIKLQPIDLEDLLGRNAITLDMSGISSMFRGKRVLISGAGGSIGSEICRQIASFAPAHISLVDNGEFNLYSIDQDLAKTYPAMPRSAIICDVRERETVDHVFRSEKPDLVFHAAALKHVPLVEANVVEAMKTNVIGTRNMADAAVAVGCDAFIMISTDKAVNPTSVMGASKRFAEAYCQSLDRNSASTRFITVRFGNVLGSAGSVVPLFKQQIAAGGPITVTHPEIERFFMTIPEAVRLVIAASVRGLSSAIDRGRIFVLDMGQPVKIVDLARKMIQLSGLRPDVDIKIEFVGLRPAEKLYEETFAAAENIMPTENTWLQVADYRPVNADAMTNALAQISAAIARCDAKASVGGLRIIVPELLHDDAENAPPPIAANIVRLNG